MSEPIRLHGKDRHEWERACIARHFRYEQLVLRILLDFAGGKAACWPANETIVGIVGLKERAIQYLLRDLEEAGTIRCVKDDTLKTRRRIVLLNHPGTKAALKGASPCTAPPKGCTKKVQGKSAKVRPGAPESLETQNEKTPDRRPADQWPSGDPEDDWLARMSPALRDRFRSLLDEPHEDG